jgi:CRISPR system Cascade subunit CasC
MFIEYHVIQNFALSCLNRDDTNSPKDCVVGGYRRARISSQCLKRSARQYFAEKAEELDLNGNLGKRTRLATSELSRRLIQAGHPEDEALQIAEKAIEALEVGQDKGRTNVLLFFGEAQFGALAKALHEDAATIIKGKEKDLKEVHAKIRAIASDSGKAVDIGLFGRMVAELTDMNVDAACQVAHAFSTHEVDMQEDFFTAVDDLQPKEDPGAGMMGMQELNSSCFYRYSLLHVGQLLENLGGDKELCLKAIAAYGKATAYAIPSGKQNSSAAQNPPLFVLVVVQPGGVARSLANAFLKPVRTRRAADKDYAELSIEALDAHEAGLTRMLGERGAKLDAKVSVYEAHSDAGVSLDALMERAAQEAF